MHIIKKWIATALLGLLIGVVSGVGLRLGAPGPTSTPSPTASFSDIRYRPLWDRYPIYYCVENLPEGTELAKDVLEGPWGWGVINRTIQVQATERCNEASLVNLWIYADYNRPDWCEGAAACVTWDGWKWRGNLWTADVCRVHVNPYWWNTASSYWRGVLIGHEFGHCPGLMDMPDQGAGVTIMDYNWAEQYPTWDDIWEVEDLYWENTNIYGYKYPAWWNWLQEHR